MMNHPLRTVAESSQFLSLAEALALVEHRMRDAVFAHASGGILEQACLAHLESGGKRTRAWLVIQALVALDVPLEWGIDFAAAVELLHNASLIHDDLEDGDRMRRGKATIGARFGDAQALNAGDFLLLLPGLVVSQSNLPLEIRAALGVVLAKSALSTAAGQAHDLALLEAGATSFDAYAKAAGGKTAPFFALPIEGAAIIAGKAVAEAAQLAEPFNRMGLLYQMCDDHADLYGEKGREAQGTDIAEGKISLLVVEHLNLCPAQRESILRILRRDRDHTTSEVIEEVRQRFIKSGAQKAAQERIMVELAAIQNHPIFDREPAFTKLTDALLIRIINASGIAQGENASRSKANVS